MRDGPIRRVLKRIALIRYIIDLSITRWIQRARGEPRYRLTGACNGCGRCCESPTIGVSAPVFRLRSLRWVALAWHRWVNGFELTGEDRRYKLFIFRCTHYDAATRGCDSYASRPGMCRDYPRNLLYEALPEFFPECGHGAVHKKAAGFRGALEATHLTPEQRRDLEKKLRLFE